MAFPTTLSEFVELGEAALQLYKRCRDSPGGHKKLAPQTRQLANVLQDFDDLVTADKLDVPRQGQLIEHGQACNELLSDLDVLLQKYGDLPTQSKRAWDRLNWDEQGLREIKDRLTNAIASLTDFYTEAITSAKSQVEVALSQLIKDYQGGHREANSVLSITSDDSNEEDSSWLQIQRDLTDLGISAAVTEDYRSFISDWFIQAINDGLLQEKYPDDKYLFPAPLSASRRSSKKLSVDSIRTRDSTPSIPLSPPAPLSPPPRPPIPVTPPYPLDSPESAPMPVSPPYPLAPPSRSPPARPPPPVPSMASLKIQSYDYDEDTMKCVVPPPLDPSQQDGMKYFVRRKPLSDEPLEPLPHQEDPIAFPRGSDQEPPIPLPADHELPMAIHGLDDPIPLSMEDTSTNIIWTAQKIVRHWNQREWEKADAQLQQQLSDVARGVTIEIKGLKRAPEQRVLRFLLGVSASLQGRYGRAKQWLDGVLSRPYRFGMPMDEGDIAAARWLGDACLMLNEPHNAALAYTIAVDAQTNNLGSTPERERLMSRTLADLREVQMKMKGLTKLQHAFEQMDDISNVYPTTDPFVKGRLVHEMMIQPRWLRCDQLQARMPSSIQIDEGYLIQPMITFAKWPIQWDPYLNAKDAVQIHCDLQNIPTFPSSTPRFALNPTAIPTTPLGQSNGLDFVTKRDVNWLVEAVRNVLLTHGIEYVERPDHFIVRLNQRVERVAFHETLVIKVRRLAMRKTFGVRVAGVKNHSRSVAFTAPVRREFADVVKAALVVAEAEASAGG